MQTVFCTVNRDRPGPICNLYSITTNQAAIINLFRVVNRYVGNLAPMPAVFPDYPAPVIRNTDAGSEMVLMRWGMPPHGARIHTSRSSSGDPITISLSFDKQQKPG